MEIHDYHIKDWVKHKSANKLFPSHMKNVRFKNFVHYDWYLKVIVLYDTSIDIDIIYELTPEKPEIVSFIREQKIKNILEDGIEYK